MANIRFVKPPNDNRIRPIQNFIADDVNHNLLFPSQNPLTHIPKPRSDDTVKNTGTLNSGISSNTTPCDLFITNRNDNSGIILPSVPTKSTIKTKDDFNNYEYGHFEIAKDQQEKECFSNSHFKSQDINTQKVTSVDKNVKVSSIGVEHNVTSTARNTNTDNSDTISEHSNQRSSSGDNITDKMSDTRSTRSKIKTECINFPSDGLNKLERKADKLNEQLDEDSNQCTDIRSAIDKNVSEKMSDTQGTRSEMKTKNMNILDEKRADKFKNSVQTINYSLDKNSGKCTDTKSSSGKNISEKMSDIQCNQKMKTGHINFPGEKKDKIKNFVQTVNYSFDEISSECTDETSSLGKNLSEKMSDTQDNQIKIKNEKMNFPGEKRAGNVKKQDSQFSLDEASGKCADPKSSSGKNNSQKMSDTQKNIKTEQINFSEEKKVEIVKNPVLTTNYSLDQTSGRCANIKPPTGKNVSEKMSNAQSTLIKVKTEHINFTDEKQVNDFTNLAQTIHFSLNEASGKQTDRKSCSSKNVSENTSDTHSTQSNKKTEQTSDTHSTQSNKKTEQTSDTTSTQSNKKIEQTSDTHSTQSNKKTEQTSDTHSTQSNKKIEQTSDTTSTQSNKKIEQTSDTHSTQSNKKIEQIHFSGDEFNKIKKSEKVKNQILANSDFLDEVLVEHKDLTFLLGKNVSDKMSNTQGIHTKMKTEQNSFTGDNKTGHNKTGENKTDKIRHKFLTISNSLDEEFGTLVDRTSSLRANASEKMSDTQGAQSKIKTEQKDVPNEKKSNKAKNPVPTINTFDKTATKFADETSYLDRNVSEKTPNTQGTQIKMTEQMNVSDENKSNKAKNPVPTINSLDKTATKFADEISYLGKSVSKKMLDNQGSQIKMTEQMNFPSEKKADKVKHQVLTSRNPLDEAMDELVDMQFSSGDFILEKVSDTKTTHSKMKIKEMNCSDNELNQIEKKTEKVTNSFVTIINPLNEVSDKRKDGNEDKEAGKISEISKLNQPHTSYSSLQIQQQKHNPQTDTLQSQNQPTDQAQNHSSVTKEKSSGSSRSICRSISNASMTEVPSFFRSINDVKYYGLENEDLLDSHKKTLNLDNADQQFKLNSQNKFKNVTKHLLKVDINKDRTISNLGTDFQSAEETKYNGLKEVAHNKKKLIPATSENNDADTEMLVSENAHRDSINSDRLKIRRCALSDPAKMIMSQEDRERIEKEVEKKKGSMVHKVSQFFNVQLGLNKEEDLI